MISIPTVRVQPTLTTEETYRVAVYLELALVHTTDLTKVGRYWQEIPNQARIKTYTTSHYFINTILKNKFTEGIVCEPLFCPCPLTRAPTYLCCQCNSLGQWVTIQTQAAAKTHAETLKISMSVLPIYQNFEMRNHRKLNIDDQNLVLGCYNFSSGTSLFLALSWV